MAIFRVTARWTGFTGAPGYSNFHFQGSTPTAGPDGERSLVHQFFTAAATNLTAGTRIQVMPEVQVFDEASGAMTGIVVDSTELELVAGTSSGNYVGPAGAVINWNTSAVVNGRRLRGRTFLVPLTGSRFDMDGTLTSTAVTSLNNAAAILSGAGFGSGFGIWSRPVGGGSGAFGEVTSHSIPDMAAVLRSRRD